MYRRSGGYSRSSFRPPFDLLHVLLKFGPGAHHLVAAAQAAEAEIHAERLLDHVTVIEYELKKACKGLEDILASGDFEDPEEIMTSVHETIKKYIYGSDSRVDTADWAKLEKFLLLAGYKQVAVKAGDDINPFRLYFDQPIAADGGTHGTIKSIQLMPFELCYSNGDEIVKLKLCGKCTYFK